MTQVETRPWFILGYVHLAAAALLALLAAAPPPVFPAQLHYLVGASGVFLVGGALAYGFASPFTKREVRSAWLSQAAIAFVFAGDGLILLTTIIHGDTMRAATLLYGAAFLVVPIDLLITATAGARWRDGIALYAKDQPFRLGDIMAVTSFALSLLMLFGAGALLVWFPRRLPSAGLVLFTLGYALPFFAGILVFLLPRNAKRKLDGITLVGAALVVESIAAISLALAFLFPRVVDFRLPSAGVLLAILLCGAAFLRIKFPQPHGAQVRRALPLLRASAALALLAGVALPLSLAGGGPGPLFGPAAYAVLLLCAFLAATCTLFGAPILLNAVPREGSWAKWSGVLAITGLFLVAPAFQYSRAAFPGAIIMVLSAMLLLWGLAPLRSPRRDCD
ncbi:MAG: hypothetical protein WDA16_06180 [Candidatus Thermoplasmatota archaeon]